MTSLIEISIASSSGVSVWRALQLFDGMLFSKEWRTGVWENVLCKQSHSIHRNIPTIRPRSVRALYTGQCVTDPTTRDLAHKLMQKYFEMTESDWRAW